MTELHGDSQNTDSNGECILAMVVLRYGAVICMACKNNITDSDNVTLVTAISGNIPVIQYSHVTCPVPDHNKNTIKYDDDFDILVVESLPVTTTCMMCKKRLRDGEMIISSAVMANNTITLQHQHDRCIPDTSKIIKSWYDGTLK